MYGLDLSSDILFEGSDIALQAGAGLPWARAPTRFHEFFSFVFSLVGFRTAECRSRIFGGPLDDLRRLYSRYH